MCVCVSSLPQHTCVLSFSPLLYTHCTHLRLPQKIPLRVELLGGKQMAQTTTVTTDVWKTKVWIWIFLVFLNVQVHIFIRIYRETHMPPSPPPPPPHTHTHTHTQKIDLRKEGGVVEIDHFNTFSESVVTYGTSNGYIHG